MELFHFFIKLQDAVLTVSNDNNVDFVLTVLSEEFSSSFESVLFRHISKHSKVSVEKLSEKLDDPQSAKPTLFTLVKIAKFFFKENNKTSSSDFAAIVSSRWEAISRISESSKENLLFAAHLLKHLLLLDKSKCQKVINKSKSKNEESQNCLYSVH
jgi:hypothetical protein